MWLIPNSASIMVKKIRGKASSGSSSRSFTAPSRAIADALENSPRLERGSKNPSSITLTICSIYLN